MSGFPGQTVLRDAANLLDHSGGRVHFREPTTQIRFGLIEGRAYGDTVTEQLCPLFALASIRVAMV